MSVVTRFAPSPTGMLHIGGARTALFNYLFARHHGGQFKLRIEDTDKNRSTPEATQAILDGLAWLGVSYDGAPIYQSHREARHREVAEELVKKGQAYYCYCTADELAQMRAEAEAKGEAFKYDRRWRDSTATPPTGVKPSIRIMAPLEGEIMVRDAVQGDVRFGADVLDDFIILRSDGTPTYMHAVVVDDHDMAVTHIIRGDDHLNNAGRQMIIYQAMGWDVPVFAHIPLIHGPDGAKLSKRHGATSVTEYAEMGYLPEAMRNYLVRLGWAHGDDELFSDAQAIEWFTLEGVGQSPSRLDFAKLNHVNAHYMRQNEARSAQLVPEYMKVKRGKSLTADQIFTVTAATPSLLPKVSTLVELADAASFYLDAPTSYDAKATEVLAKGRDNLKLLFQPIQLTAEQQATLKTTHVARSLEVMPIWDAESIKVEIGLIAAFHNKKLGELMPPMRAAIVGAMSGPDVPTAMAILGKEESLKRLKAAAEA